MKKIGLFAFLAALTLGIIVASVFSFGRVSVNLFSFAQGVQGSGVSKSEQRTVKDFKAIDVGGIFKVEITVQKDFDVRIEADENLLPLIKTRVDGQTLRIETDQKISPKSPVIIRISAPDIEAVETSGVARVSLTNVGNDLLKLNSSGASRIKIEGVTKIFQVEMSGASRLDADDLRTENTKIGASGASRANIFVSNDLEADLSGASKVYYSGNPKDLKKNTSGASCIREK